MSKTARLSLPYIHSSQAQKEITHNEALTILDVLINPVVQEINVNLPPDSRAGELYIVGQQPEGRFRGHNNEIAAKLEHGWQFVTPIKWQEVILDSDGSKYRFNGTEWIALSALTSVAVPQPQVANNILINKDTGEYLKIEHLQEDVLLQGSIVDTEINIPHHSIVIAVNVRVLEEIIGASSFSVGVAEDVTRYGNNLGVAKDTTSVGLTNYPLTYWQDTRVSITANDGNFAAGKVQVTVQLLKPHGAWNWD